MPRKSKHKLRSYPLIDPAALPAQYGLRVVGDCMAPALKDGQDVLVDKSLSCDQGDMVVIYPRPEFLIPGQPPCSIKRLRLGMSRHFHLPWKPGPISDVMPVLVVGADNREGKWVMRYDQLLAVHRCLGPIAAGVKTVDMTASAGLPEEVEPAAEPEADLPFDDGRDLASHIQDMDEPTWRAEGLVRALYLAIDGARFDHDVETALMTLAESAMDHVVEVKMRWAALHRQFQRDAKAD